MRIASHEFRVVDQRRGRDQCVKRVRFVDGRQAFARCQHDVVGAWLVKLAQRPAAQFELDQVGTSKFCRSSNIAWASGQTDRASAVPGCRVRPFKDFMAVALYLRASEAMN